MGNWDDWNMPWVGRSLPRGKLCSCNFRNLCLSVCMSDHDSWTPNVDAWELVEPRECSLLGLNNLSWVGWLLDFKAKLGSPESKIMIKIHIDIVKNSFSFAIYI